MEDVMEVGFTGARGLKRKADDRLVPPTPKRIKVPFAVSFKSDSG